MKRRYDENDDDSDQKNYDTERDRHSHYNIDNDRDTNSENNGDPYTDSDFKDNANHNESDFTKEEEPVRSYGHLWTRCTNENCYGLNYKQWLKERLNICEYCGFHLKMSSSDRIEFLIDPGTWNPMDEDMVSVDPISWTGEDEIKYVDPRTGKYFVNPENGEYVDPFTWNPKPKDDEEEKEEDMGSEAPFTWEPRPLTCNFLDEKKYCGSGDPLTWNLTDDEENEYMGYADPLTCNPRAEDEEDEEDMAPIPFHLKEEPYQTRLDSYQETTGLKDAVQTGTGRLNGIPLAIAIMEFEFIGGTMGSVVGEKITRLVEYATNHSLPLIIVCASGGARMQEGSLSLMQMAKIASALNTYQIKKLLYVSILTSPTTGGVTASFGMLGDIVVAEPDAYIAFAGKRVIEELLKVEVPEGSQSAEVLFEKGLVDFILPRSDMKEALTFIFWFHGFYPLK